MSNQKPLAPRFKVVNEVTGESTIFHDFKFGRLADENMRIFLRANKQSAGFRVYEYNPGNNPPWIKIGYEPQLVDESSTDTLDFFINGYPVTVNNALQNLIVPMICNGTESQSDAIKVLQRLMVDRSVTLSLYGRSHEILIVSTGSGNGSPVEEAQP